MDYIELNIELSEIHPWREIIISDLANAGFESFVETKTGLNSYIAESEFTDDMLEVLNGYNDYIISKNFKKIEDENWNAKWEENFDPVFVEDKLVIIAPFHDAVNGYKETIVIQPQMSFGTGHHQTTWLISRKLFELDLNNKLVLDMGTGTGVLAILAEKLNAKSIFAPDIDKWSYENAIENVKLNNCSKIEVALGDDKLLSNRSFDVIIANINKNILIQHLKTYSDTLKSGGKLLLSGFFETDKTDLVHEAEKYGFIFESIDTKDEWAMLELSKK